MASTTRRPVSTRTKQRVATSTDQLADKLSSLAISKPQTKGKEKATLPLEDPRMSAMRAVNSASQALTDMAKSGWRKSSDVPPPKRSAAFVSASASAALAAKHLALLRDMSPRDLDIERAAGSVLGKLVTLEMFDPALVALQEIHPRLCVLSQVHSTATESPGHLHLLSIPLPESSPEPILLTLITTYLLHALTTISYIISTPTSKAAVAPFTHALTAAPTLLSWAQLLTALPPSHADSVFTRAYSCLIKLSTAFQLKPKAQREVFLIREYALSCLTYTTPGKVEPRSFWDQAIKSAAAYIKGLESAPEDHENATPIVSTAFSQIIERVQARPDAANFMSGRGFIAFCECWMSFANRTGDIATLDRIATFIGNHPGSSREAKTLNSEDRGNEKIAPEPHNFVLQCTQLCTALAQMITLLDPKASDVGIADLSKRVRETSRFLQTHDIPALLAPGSEDDEVQRLSGKVERALERARRSIIKVVESPTAPNATSDVIVLLEAIVDILEQVSRTRPTTGNVTAVLDTLFVLARIKLIVGDPRTHAPSHGILARAAALLQVEARGSVSAADKANYARCHGSAIRYLQDGCALGRTALQMHAALSATGVNDDPQMVEGWKQLEEQLWRRWELLGLAFEGFLDSVQAFPYLPNEFAKHTRQVAFGAVFESSSAAVQLGTIVDRLTYVGACELLLAPEKVSLLSIGPEDPNITGALLERQTQSLDGSRWKESTRSVVREFLRATLEVYSETEMPVRRARTLVRCLEFAYHAGPEYLEELGSPSHIGEEIERIIVRKVSTSLLSLPFCAQYRASAHLWLALHAHRRADPEQATIVAHHVDLACKVLEPVTRSAQIGEPSPKGAKKSLPKQTVVVPKRAPASRRPVTVRKVAPQRDPVAPQPKARKGAPPSKTSTDRKKSPTPFDDFEKFLSLLQLATRILGLLAHVLLKVHLLDLTRKLCERNSDTPTDGYVNASRATSIFTHTLTAVKSGKISDDVYAMFFLRHAESLAMVEDLVRSSDFYNEALTKAQGLGDESKGMSTVERVQCRVGRLEKAAVASHVFALIQYSREDIASSLEAMLQSLRLWNRAADTLARLNPPSASKPVEEDNPFDMSTVRDALPTDNGGQPTQKVLSRRPSMGALEWRVSEGLLATLFALCEAYFTRGSAREAEYFAQQAHDLAQALNAPAMAGRALARKGELQLHQGHLKEGHDSLTQAANLLQNLPGKDAADIQRLCGDYNQLSSQDKDAQQLYEEATKTLEELDQTFGVFDGAKFGPRKSTDLSTSATREILLPELLADVFRRHIWLLRDRGNDYAPLLERFLALPAVSRAKAQENALMAKLTLHEVYGRFRTDMFLSSLAESTIALPMGMSTDKVPSLSPSTHDILHTLDRAEQLFWLDFTLFSRRGDVPRVRNAVVSLALIRALQTSLGKSGNQDPVLVSGLLDVSTAITLGREMLEAIQHKFPTSTTDDLQWPLLNRNGSPLPRLQNEVPLRFALNNSFGSELDVSDDEGDVDEKSQQDYWESIRSKYQGQAPDISTLSASQMSGVPDNWTVVHLSVTDDKSTLFVTRQRGGDVKATPLVFCVPLKGRRDNEEDEHLTFEDALREFKDIVKLSDDGTRGAVHIKDDPEARARWWKERIALDTRMRELLENIEFCWLGAFKTILSPRVNLTNAAISDLRLQFDKVFHRSLRFQNKKVKPKTNGHKRLPSESQIPSKVTLDDVLLECFSTLSPKCRDEELEDLAYFMLDLYQFHGVPVAIAEVDIDQVVVDLRGVLEEHAARMAGRRKGAGPAITKVEDEHMFLILDKNVQGLPWESIPILRGKSVSRIPSVDFLLDRVQLAGWMVRSPAPAVADRAVVDPHKGYCVLNPSGDLVRTEGRFKGWLADMEKVGWEGVVGQAPSEQQFVDALRKKDLVVYFGHGGAEQYIRSHQIRNLPRCAATMLWGCSSGSLREMGDFDRVGTPYNYMLAGCPTLVANIWDVTDRDIDIFSQSVFEKLKLSADGVRSWDASGGSREKPISLVAAVAQSRNSCKLKYLTGAAPVVYGIPFYL
ncbi:peptidase family C50-domain-containing protein [Mycena sp. CBHHK59/15]|nr:peptidase family C50-domain-containing protein [Mycena sp. CBHHK59/15]